MMFHAKPPSRFLLDYFSTAVFLLNKLPSPMLNIDSPFFRLYNRHSNYNMLRTLGSKCFGYNTKHKGYKFLYPPPNHIYTSRHIVFDESILLYSQPTMMYDSPPVEGELSNFTEWNKDTSSSIVSKPIGTALQPSASAFAPPISISIPEEHVSPSSPIIPDQITQTAHLQNSSLPTPSTQHPMQTRSRSGIYKPNPLYANLHTMLNIPAEPRSIKSTKNHHGWSAALAEELKHLLSTKLGN